MSSPYEGNFDDLFDFPEVAGLEEFGLVPPVREGTDLSEFEMEPGTLEPAASAPDEAEESAAEADDADDGDRSFIAEARPNPPVPEGVTDLDEDLFGFDELFSLEDDPFYNGTLGADGMPANDIFVADANQVTEGSAAPEDTAPAAADPQATEPAAEQPSPQPVAEAPASPEPAPAPEPAQANQAAAGVAAPAAPAPSVNRQAPPSQAPGSLMGQPAGPAATLDRGPRILLPEDVPYGGPDNSKMIWALIGCFLIVNTGIFWLAHMASTNVNNSLTQATGLIASALAQGQSQGQPQAPTQSPTVASTPPDAGAGVGYEVEAPPVDVTAAGDTPTAPAPVDPAPRAVEPTPEHPEPWVDPRDFSDPFTFAVNSAKAMLDEGRYEDARRLLNHVLANQSQMPLTVSLREEIHFLIGLTYYVQGTATAPEAGRVQR